MFENLLDQPSSKSLSDDIRKGQLPRSILFAGPEGSGKLTAALECARSLSCTGEKKGLWTCTCPSCLQTKALTSSNIMVLGPRDCSLEISAAKGTFINALQENASYLTATRYLFTRAVRKLSLRFNGILWWGESNLSKIASLIESINENLEILDMPHELPTFEKVSKICDDLEKDCAKLEDEFLYDSIPINQIRNMEEWAHTKTEEGKKTIIIENADRMLPGVRNALLKILEEPPADCIFILLTAKRNAVMQTILSRVRTYSFVERKMPQQQNVIKRVFHNDYFNGSVNDYLLTFLPVSPGAVKEQAEIFYSAVANHQVPDVAAIAKECGNFTPRLELRIFILAIFNKLKTLRTSQAGCEFSVAALNLLRKCWDNVTMYNQSPAAALELLLRDLSALNVQNGSLMK